MSLHQTQRGTWQVRWRDPGNRQRARTFNRRVDAQKFEAKVRHEIARGEYTGGREHTSGNTGRFTVGAGTLVYVAFGAVGQVLYVGVTDDLFGRMASHRRSAAWWPLLYRIEWEEHPTRARALQREAALVVNHGPPHNFVGKPGQRPA